MTASGGEAPNSGSSRRGSAPVNPRRRWARSCPRGRRTAGSGGGRDSGGCDSLKGGTEAPTTRRLRVRTPARALPRRPPSAWGDVCGGGVGWVCAWSHRRSGLPLLVGTGVGMSACPAPSSDAAWGGREREGSRSDWPRGPLSRER